MPGIDEELSKEDDMNSKIRCIMAGLAVVGFMIVGCESTKTEDNVITINPASVTLTNDWETVTFTASLTSSNVALALPLVWSVSDPDRGRIRASGGLTAIYEATNHRGNNTITVRDQGDNEGIAVVVH